MRFSNGYWLLRDDVQARYAVEAEGFGAADNALTIYAATRHIQHRGDTLSHAMLTVRASSPMEGVIRVRVSHFDGGVERGPAFAIAEAPAGAASVDGDAATFTSGELSLHVARNAPWNMEFRAGGRVLTASRNKAMASIRKAGLPYMHEQLQLGVGDLVYGLGERFSPFVKNGQTVDIWNLDGGTSSEQTYKNIPLYLTNRGYGVFINNPGAVSLEVASERVTRVQFSVPGEVLEYFVIYGPTPREILARYTALTGRAALPPAWSFGLWLSTSFTTDYSEETVTSFIQGMADRDMPLSVFHFDCFWMRQFNWCDLAWDSTCFPDPEGMLQRLKARGLRICVWINPYIAQRSPLFAEGKANGYLLRHPNGNVYQTDDWQAGMGVVDFTNPDACAWYQSKLRALLDMGVDTFKTDFGERIPTDVVYHDGSDPVLMHNYFTLLYNRTVFTLLEQERGVGEAVVFARSATTGNQMYPVHWGGDCESTFEAMAETLRGGLSLGLSGFGFWSHDIGGFEGKPDPALYKRWLPFGLLSSHSRLHGSGSYRVPWVFDDEAVDVLRAFTKLKASLMPYLYQQAVVATTQGTPMLRAMMLEFPDDPGCATLDRQYMLGDSLLVAPVFTAEGDVEYYVPAGRWTHYLTGAVVEGPRWVREQHGFNSVPLLVRPGSVIPVGPVTDRPDYDYAAGLTLRTYALPDGAAAQVTVPDSKPSAAGAAVAQVTVARSGGTITVDVDGDLADLSVVLVGVQNAAAQAGCTVAASDDGVRVTPAAGARRMVVALES